jgi:hypothetical protein
MTTQTIKKSVLIFYTSKEQQTITQSKSLSDRDGLDRASDNTNDIANIDNTFSFIRNII